MKSYKMAVIIGLAIPPALFALVLGLLFLAASMQGD